MARELNTIQKVEKLNKVYAEEDRGPGNAPHYYCIADPKDGTVYAEINFQKGPRKDPESQHGVLDTDLLEIVRDRMKGFQSGEFATEDNAKALEHIELALMYLNKRVMDRYERNVLGTYEK